MVEFSSLGSVDVLAKLVTGHSLIADRAQQVAVLGNPSHLEKLPDTNTVNGLGVFPALFY